MAKGFLDPAYRNDSQAIGSAIEELMLDWLSCGLRKIRERSVTFYFRQKS
jgi:hypothetical protein